MRRSQADEAQIERTALDQLVLASELKPKRFRTLPRRNKWLDVLADVQLPSQTTVGALLREDPASCRILGGSKSWHCPRSSPLDSQVFGLARSCTRVTIPRRRTCTSWSSYKCGTPSPVQEERPHSLTRLLCLHGPTVWSTLHLNQEGAYGNIVGVAREQTGSEIPGGCPCGAGGTVGRRSTTSILSFNGVVAPAPVVGDTAFRRPPWTGAEQRSLRSRNSDRQIDTLEGPWDLINLSVHGSSLSIPKPVSGT